MPSLLTRTSRNRDRVARFELVPMIDVMMILSIFLAVMAFLPQVRTTLQAQLPEASEATDTPPAFTVELSKDGLAFEGIPLSTPEAAVEMAKAKLAERADVSFVIAADKRLPYEQVIALLNALKSAGAKKIGLAALKQAPAATP